MCHLGNLIFERTDEIAPRWRKIRPGYEFPVAYMEMKPGNLALLSQTWKGIFHEKWTRPRVLLIPPSLQDPVFRLPALLPDSIDVSTLLAEERKSSRI